MDVFHSNNDDHAQRDANFAASLIQDLCSVTGYSAAELDACMEAERDVLGTQGQSIFVSQTRPEQEQKKKNQAMSLLARKCFEEALTEHFSLEEQQPYLNIKQMAPHLIELESSPEKYLIASEWNYWQAAKNFLAYWQKRQQVFGPERFCKPLRLNEGSALDPLIIEAFVSGVWMVAEKPDRYQRTVIILDRNKFTPRTIQVWADAGLRMQMAFYSLQVLTESERAVRNGFVTLRLFGSKSLEETNVAQIEGDE